jgi:pyruvate kinase
MLSEETAVGGHPVAAAATMARIIAAAAREPLDPLAGLAIRSPAEALAEAACDLASRIGAAAIVAATESGYTATAVARFRPACPVVGLTPNPVTARRLALVWGVWPVLREGYHDLDDMSAKAVEAARSLGVARPGSTLVCTAGLPFDRRGGTDLIRIVTA